jgi:hypothetical protein
LGLVLGLGLGLGLGLWLWMGLEVELDPRLDLPLRALASLQLRTIWDNAWAALANAL